MSEKEREYQKDYYKKNKAKIRERNKEWIDKHPGISKIYWQKHYQKHKEEYRVIGKARVLSRKQMIINHYGGVCSCCGEKHLEFLSIDHIGGGGNKHRRELKKNHQLFYNWIVKENYPEGFRVLCMNCNFAHGKYGYCPHEKTRVEVTA